MVSLQAWMLCAAMLGASETVLLEFSAPWCGPCQSMAPTVQRLMAEGYPVRQIDVDRHRQLAAQYGVTAVPCFVMLVDGRPVSRVEGAVSHAALVQMFGNARVAPARPAAEPAPGQSPDRQMSPAADPQDGGLRTARESQGIQLQPVRFDSPSPTRPPEQAPETEKPRPRSAELVERARLATVRLRIEDDRGHSFGTGTIIDTHGEEALVLTCGHIFRDSGGRGPITVDLFAPGAASPVAGQLIHYDLQRDIGLVSICPKTAVVPVRVAPGDYRVRRGDEVFTVGCDRGGDPTVRESQITAIDKYLGSPNVEVAGQPVDGRSGGGLFSADGYLVGICNAADPADDEGIYAALSTVHQQLDLIGQRRIYDSASSSPAASEGAPDAPRDASFGRSRSLRACGILARRIRIGQRPRRRPQSGTDGRRGGSDLHHPLER